MKLEWTKAHINKTGDPISPCVEGLASSNGVWAICHLAFDMNKCTNPQDFPITYLPNTETNEAILVAKMFGLIHVHTQRLLGVYTNHENAVSSAEHLQDLPINWLAKDITFLEAEMGKYPNIRNILTGDLTAKQNPMLEDLNSMLRHSPN